METVCPLSVKHLFFQIYSGHKHLSSCHNNLLSCVFVSFDWIIWQVSMGNSGGNASFPQWVYMILSQKLASDLWTNCEEWWTARETGWAEISGDSIILAQPGGVVALKDNSRKGNPLEISLCLGQKLLHWPCARKWSLSSGCLLSHCHSPSQPKSFLAAPEKWWRVKWQCSSKAPPATGDVELSLQQGSEKLKISSTSSLKHVSFSIYFRSLESGIVPTANSSWIILGFGVDSHTTQEVLDPISSALDRAICNSGARVSSLRISTLL